MATAHNVTTKRDIVKPLQFVTEGDTITTPASYGIIPTASPSFTIAGLNTDIDLDVDIRDLTVDVLGSEDIVDAVKSEELYAFTCKYDVPAITLPAYGINASGGGAGSIDSSLSFLFSEYLDGTEYYNIMKGCRPTSTTMSLERGKWICDQTWVAQDIIQRVTTHGLTTPTFASITSSSPYMHSGAGADPFVWNSVAFPENKFSCTVTRQMATMALNGDLKILYTKPVSRSIMFSVDVFAKGVTLETDYRAKTLRSATYSINTGASKSFAFTNAHIKTWKVSRSATSTDAVKESITCEAEAVAI